MTSLTAVNPAALWLRIQLFRFRRSVFFIRARLAVMTAVAAVAYVLGFVPVVGFWIARDLAAMAVRRAGRNRAAFIAGYVCGILLAAVRVCWALLKFPFLALLWAVRRRN